MKDLQLSQDHLVFAQLMKDFHASEGHAPESRWYWLMAAHIVGQHYFALHWRNHAAMLGFAFRMRDYPEVAGQLLRLVLVPLGHLIGNLPTGNIGRATVSAFKRMEIDPPMHQLISDTRAKTHQSRMSAASTNT